MTATITEVAEGVFRIDLPLPFPSPEQINVYLLRTEARDVLVDSGMMNAAPDLEGALKELGAALSQVVITHNHLDHWAASSHFTDTVHGHPGLAVIFEHADDFTVEEDNIFGADHEAFARMMDQMREAGMFAPAPKVESLGDGERIGEWEVLWTPGHSADHICLLRESDGTLLAGDHLLADFTPNIHIEETAPDPVHDFMNSLERVAALPVQLVLPAHGDPFTEHAQQAQKLIEHHHRRLAKIEAALADGPAATPEITRAIFSQVYRDDDTVFAQMETHAHLEYLRIRGRVEEIKPRTWARATCKGGLKPPV